MTLTIQRQASDPNALLSLVSLATAVEWDVPVRYASSEPQLITAERMAAQDAEWDSLTEKHSAALDELFADLTARAKRGENKPLNFDDLAD